MHDPREAMSVTRHVTQPGWQRDIVGLASGKTGSLGGSAAN